MKDRAAMSDDSLLPERWDAFTDVEVTAIASSLAQTCHSITEGYRDMDAAEADLAACTLLVVGRLLYSISEFNGEERPSLETLEAVASGIARASKDYSDLLKPSGA
jgi:hypothetical protein